jgi:hypothetical protein
MMFVIVVRVLCDLRIDIFHHTVHSDINSNFIIKTPHNYENKRMNRNGDLNLDVIRFEFSVSVLRLEKSRKSPATNKSELH